MIRIKVFSIFIIVFFSNYLLGQDAAKNIIVIEEELNSNERKDYLNQEEANVLDDKNKLEAIKEPVIEDSYIVVDDIPKKFNAWYGVLPSEEGGLGWMMWGRTNKEYALSLLRKTNFKTSSGVLKKLTINFLLSRANEPQLEKMKSNQNNIIKKPEPFIYFKEKIKILSEIGDAQSIEKLIDSIPLEIKGQNFEAETRLLREQSIDIPNTCSNALNKKKNTTKSLEKRKNLIACNVALKKTSQAQLAIDLLENDSLESLPYTVLAREMIERPNIKSINNFNDGANNINIKIISLVDYEIAKKIYFNETIELDKIIYDMNLYEKEIQIQSLERLVEHGFYDVKDLEKAYISFYNYIQSSGAKDSLKDIETENSVRVRAKLYYLVNNTISNLERAQYLNLLWVKATKIGIEKSVYMLTSNIVLSLKPDPELSWFIYPATKALLVSNKLEQAKSWLFYLSEDLYNRSSLDINFCKYLILLYLKDNNLQDKNLTIPEIDFLLKRLASSLEVSKKDFFRILISLKSLDYKIDDSFWKSFYMEDSLSIKPSKNLQLDNLYFNLDMAVKNKNIAETVLISLNILNTRDKDSFNYYNLFKPLNALYKLGLKQYVREFVLELNLDVLN